jgi:hypothetical protein
LEIVVDTEAILSSPVIYHVDKELFQKVLKIKFTFKDTFTPWAMQLWDLYQTINNGYTYDEDTSYNHILTSIRENYIPKTDKHLRDEFCKIYDKGEEKYLDFALLYCWFKIYEDNGEGWIGIQECVKDVDDERSKHTL